MDEDIVEIHGANVGANCDDELFKEGRAQVHLTRRQKWEGRQEYAAEKATREAKSRWGMLDLTTDALRQQQSDDSTLQTIHTIANGEKGLLGGEGFYFKDGVLY